MLIQIGINVELVENSQGEELKEERKVTQPIVQRKLVEIQEYSTESEDETFVIQPPKANFVQHQPAPSSSQIPRQNPNL